MATCFFAKFVFLCWLSAITGVLAGNRAWEPKVAEDLHNSTGSVQNHHLGKRWYIIEADPSHKLWPRGNIKVCFQARSHAHEGGVTKTTEEILRGRLEGARKLWRDAGLDDHDGWFEFEFLPVNDPLCHDESRRKEFLLVIYAGYDVEIMGTTPGKRTTLKTDVSFDKSGPSMTLSDSLEMGMKNVVANFAHEMGHLFGDGNFECESLSDYEAAKERVIARSKGNTETIKKNLLAMCKDQATANLFEFTGAMNWLPLQFATGPDRNVPDWDSIMICEILLHPFVL
ncbi:predicted protein [Uncinocarpus reesii 1704]|uniref:Peptidase M12B domain-containing protein n=1 Tax=Uncinocarpus reesii (strain UAMH 1704) TaxID=336963 RepID=C4JYD3_UNCRE|nr:uncharacterized protein UREG_07184 [Uncinocarpus reesii 1704]EEP82319.1 predicted protein [Uncinocarpus reesii 1704]